MILTSALLVVITWTACLIWVANIGVSVVLVSTLFIGAWVRVL